MTLHAAGFENPEIEAYMKLLLEQEGTEAQRLRMVAKNAESAPWLCLLEGRRDGKSGLQILPGLFLYTKDGTLCAEMQRLQQPYSEQGGVDG